MIVTCQSCLQHYTLDESKLNPLGSKVKCAKCKAVFTVFPPDIEPMAEELAPPPPPTPPTTQPLPPPTPSTTQAPKTETQDSADQEVVLEAGPDDVVIVMSGTDKVSTADAVEAGSDTVVISTSDAVADPEPFLDFEKKEDPDITDAEVEPPVTASEVDRGREEEEAPSKSGCLPFFFFLLLFASVAYGALVYLDKKGFEMPWLEGMNLPYISQSSDAKQSLPHEMITVADINSRFIRNNVGDPLFVISGKLTNMGSNAQQAIQVTGELFDETNSVLAREIIVGGRFLSDLDLLALSQGELDQKLSSMNKAKETPVIDAGASVPFMVIFSDLDDRLKEFSIKVTGSEPAS